MFGRNFKIFDHIDHNILAFKVKKILPLFFKKTYVSFVKYKGNMGLFSKTKGVVFLLLA